jgi:hypothetical protein
MKLGVGAQLYAPARNIDAGLISMLSHPNMALERRSPFCAEGDALIS